MGTQSQLQNRTDRTDPKSHTRRLKSLILSIGTMVLSPTTTDTTEVLPPERTYRGPKTKDANVISFSSPTTTYHSSTHTYCTIRSTASLHLPSLSPHCKVQTTNHQTDHPTT